MTILPVLVLFLVFVGVLFASRASRGKAAAAKLRMQEQITVGTEVMTTSGLYATVVSLDNDGTAVLSIAPGVEVKWSVAALRPTDELPDQYRPRQERSRSATKPARPEHGSGDRPSGELDAKPGSGLDDGPAQAG